MLPRPDAPWHCWRCRAEKTYPHGWCATPGCDCDECLTPTAAELAAELVRKFREWEFDRDGQPHDLAGIEEQLAEYGVTVADRDNLVRAAYAAGVPKGLISVLTGIARTTINRILARPPAAVDEAADVDGPPSSWGLHAFGACLAGCIYCGFERDRLTGDSDGPGS